MIQSSSDLLATGTQLGDHGFDALLVDGAQCVVGYAQLDPALFAGNPETTLVQVRLPAATVLVVGVRDVVAGTHALACDLALTSHDGLHDRCGSPIGQDDVGPARQKPLRDVPGRLSRNRVAPRRPSSCKTHGQAVHHYRSSFAPRASAD